MNLESILVMAVGGIFLSALVALGVIDTMESHCKNGVVQVIEGVPYQCVQVEVRRKEQP